MTGLASPLLSTLLLLALVGHQVLHTDASFSVPGFAQWGETNHMHPMFKPTRHHRHHIHRLQGATGGGIQDVESVGELLKKPSTPQQGAQSDGGDSFGGVRPSTMGIFGF